jgi:D-glycero-D-manno-heptose 1,7-bisphosphate phosphatase
MNSAMKRAVFLDRDGVINSDKDLYYVTRTEDFRINPGVVEFLSELHSMGYLIIIITNQGGISKGLYSLDTIDEIHALMRSELEKKNVHITEIYFCPHHPDFGNCICRKPDSLLIEKALARFGIDPEHSFFIGDREGDMEAAKKAGIKAIKVDSNENLLKYLRVIGQL